VARPHGPGAYSASVLGAFDWAGVTARMRERAPAGSTDPPIGPMDLFLGALLTQGDADGEVSVLLTHFGLTARDVIGDAYPSITPESLSIAAEQASPSPIEPDGQTRVRDILVRAQSLGGTQARLLHLVGALLLAPSELWTPLDAAFSSIGESRAAVAESYERWIKTRKPTTAAGKSLRLWLAENNPRSPADIAGFSSDIVDGQSDLIGISAEANALAYLIGSRELAPPLAIGLFGEWGSGKSFLMRSVENKVGGLVELVKDVPQADASAWKNIKQIRFSAWEYVQGDLWAGILERIFEELGERVAVTGLVKRRKAPLEHDLTEQQEVVSSAEKLRNEIATEANTAQIALNNANEALREESARAVEAAPELEAASRKAVESALTDLWDTQRVEALGGDAAALLSALADARRELQHGLALLSPHWRNKRYLARLTAAALVVPVVTSLLQLVGVPAVTALLTGLATVVPVLTVGLQSFARWTQEQLQHIEAAESQVHARFEAPLKAAEARANAARKKVEEVNLELDAQTLKVQAKRAQALSITAEIAALTPGRVFVEFADVRSTDYRRRLGLLATVRADLKDLEKEILANNAKALEPLGEPDAEIPNRIVLYIDDLDRCPPDKVLQVLEAVHLLLAFQQFVVAVAVDRRWLRSALVLQLPALRDAPAVPHHGSGPGPDPTEDAEDRPTAQDYVEKIFQLPLWIQSVSPKDRSKMVTGLLSGSVRAESGGSPGGQTKVRVGPEQVAAVNTMLSQGGTGLRRETSPLALSANELQFLGTLGPILGDTPRRIKRFVNTVQLLLSMRPALSADGPQSQRLSLCLLAAIHEGLPGVARIVFSADRVGVQLNSVLTSFEAPAEAPAKTPVKTLAKTPAKTPEEELDAFRGRLPEWAKARAKELANELGLLRAWLADPANEVWGTITPNSIGTRLDMIKRIGFDPPDF
jgi:KAP family P-loop domain